MGSSRVATGRESRVATDFPTQPTEGHIYIHTTIIAFKQMIYSTNRWCETLG